MIQRTVVMVTDPSVDIYVHPRSLHWITHDLHLMTYNAQFNIQNPTLMTASLQIQILPLPDCMSFASVEYYSRMCNDGSTT